MSTLLKVATGVVVGLIAVCGGVAIASYYKVEKLINKFDADTEAVMKDLFGDEE